jgi:hypothetical protein
MGFTQFAVAVCGDERRFIRPGSLEFAASREFLHTLTPTRGPTQ